MTFPTVYINNIMCWTIQTKHWDYHSWKHFKMLYQKHFLVVIKSSMFVTNLKQYIRGSRVYQDCKINCREVHRSNSILHELSTINQVLLLHDYYDKMINSFEYYHLLQFPIKSSLIAFVNDYKCRSYFT